MDDKPSRRPRMPLRPEAPEFVVAEIERARKRTAKRSVTAPFGLERDADDNIIVDEQGRHAWAWPFAQDQSKWPEWFWLVLDAFGTRNSAVAGTFLRHLMDLCATEWDAASETWVPDDGEMQLMLGIVRSHKPRDEAEAARAAQVASAHIVSMRVAKRVADAPWDTRMVSAYARLLQAQAELSEVAGTSKARRTAKQSIKVVRETHVHHHQHIHVPGGGEEKENQAHGTDGVAKLNASLASDGATVSCDQSGRNILRLSRRKGQARV